MMYLHSPDMIPRTLGPPCYGWEIDSPEYYVIYAYPFTEREQGAVAVDDRARATAELVENARGAEAAGLDVLAELVTRLGG